MARSLESSEPGLALRRIELGDISDKNEGDAGTETFAGAARCAAS